jgi:hypothetical protein
VVLEIGFVILVATTPPNRGMTMTDELALLVGRIDGKIDGIEGSVKTLEGDMKDVKKRVINMEGVVDNIDKNTNGAAEVAGRFIDNMPLKAKQFLLFLIFAFFGGIGGAEFVGLMS